MCVQIITISYYCQHQWHWPLVEDGAKRKRLERRGECKAGLAAPPTTPLPHFTISLVTSLFSDLLAGGRSSLPLSNQMSFLPLKTLLPKKVLSSRFLPSTWIKLSAYFLWHLLFCKVEIFSQVTIYTWVRGWRSGESTRQPPLCPVFDSRTRRHTCVEFVFGSRPCSDDISPDSPVFLPPKNQHSIFEFHCIRSLRKI